MASAAWQGRQILDPAHAHDLEQRAAVHEFSDRMPRDAAEDAAHRSYRREHHLAAAAHHLRGMLATHAAGDRKSAAKHGLHYQLHAQALGHDPSAEVPAEIRSRAQSEQAGRMYAFKGHPADQLVSEHLGHQMVKGELAKGDVIQFPVARARQPGGGRFDVGHQVQDLGRRWVGPGKVLARRPTSDHAGNPTVEYDVAWPKPKSWAYPDGVAVQRHLDQELGPHGPVKSEDAVDETPGQKLQKFWDEKRAGDGARELAKRASAAVAGLLLRRLSKGLAGDANPSLNSVGSGSASTSSTPPPLAMSEALCKECGGGPHPPGQHAAAKAEESPGEKKEICAGCGEHWPCSVDRNRKSYRGEIAAKHHPSGKFVDAWPAKTKKSERSAEAAAPLYHSGGKKTCPDCRRKLTEVVSDAPHLKCDHCGRKFKKSEKDLSDEALAKFWADKKSEPGFKYQE